MKTVLCYGDSNTWGADPAIMGNRFDLDVRWPGVLRNALGDGYWVIEEGLGGRTTVWDDPIEGYKNGKEYLTPCLNTHRPLDLVTVMLGTNDLKKRFSLSAYDIAQGVGVLVKMIQQSECGPNNSAPKVLLMCPPPVAKLTNYAEMFEDSVPRSKRLAEHYQRVAQELGCEFLNAGSVMVSSDLDGIHFEAGEHQKLGLAVAKEIRRILG